MTVDNAFGTNGMSKLDEQDFVEEDEFMQVRRHVSTFYPLYFLALFLSSPPLLRSPPLCSCPLFLSCPLLSPPLLIVFFTPPLPFAVLLLFVTRVGLVQPPIAHPRFRAQDVDPLPESTPPLHVGELEADAEPAIEQWRPRNEFRCRVREQDGCLVPPAGESSRVASSRSSGAGASRPPEQRRQSVCVLFLSAVGSIDLVECTDSLDQDNNVRSQLGSEPPKNCPCSACQNRYSLRAQGGAAVDDGCTRLTFLAHLIPHKSHRSVSESCREDGGGRAGTKSLSITFVLIFCYFLRDTSTSSWAPGARMGIIDKSAGIFAVRSTHGGLMAVLPGLLTTFPVSVDCTKPKYIEEEQRRLRVHAILYTFNLILRRMVETEGHFAYRAEQEPSSVGVEAKESFFMTKLISPYIWRLLPNLMLAIQGLHNLWSPDVRGRVLATWKGIYFPIELMTTVDPNYKHRENLCGASVVTYVRWSPVL
eukprot:694423-Hanusia_phi.AAC.4